MRGFKWDFEIIVMIYGTIRSHMFVTFFINIMKFCFLKKKKKRMSLLTSTCQIYRKQKFLISPENQLFACQHYAYCLELINTY